MKKITQKELDKKLKLHELWLDDNTRGIRLDLNWVDLEEVDLEGANLQYASLRGSNLRNVNLRRTNLQYVDLNEANLYFSDLAFANLKAASLIEVNLKGSDLTNANLNYTDLNDADLSNTDLTDANLNYADLQGANITHIQGLKVFSIDNIGTFKGKVTYIPKLDKVFAGCWEGSLERFLDKGLEMNKGNKVESQNIRLAYLFFKNNKEE
ncbi:hypothetical protein [Staphylococcus phage PT94]